MILIKIIAYLFAGLVVALMVHTVYKAVRSLFRKVPDPPTTQVPKHVDTYLRCLMSDK